MKKGHLLRRNILNIQNSLERLCNNYAQRLEDSINPMYLNSLLDRQTLRITAMDFTNEVNDFITAGIREGIQLTLTDLEKNTGYVLDMSHRLLVEAKIENQLRRTFVGKTLQQRLDSSQRRTTALLLQTYNLKQSGLNQTFKDVFTGTIFGWNHRLISTEILRAYHYTVLEFARETSANAIEFIFDEAQLLRRLEYRELADGGPYKVDSLPDYPRPYASYSLKISY